MYVTVNVACAGWDQARAIARRLVEDRLAACVQLAPIESVYRWHGELATDQEILLVAKTRADRFDGITATVMDMHSYEVPEITMTPMNGGSEQYLRWIDESVSSGAPTDGGVSR